SEDVVIAGHGRLLAAGQLGMKTVPTIQLQHLSPDQVRALRIADNSIPEGGMWSPEILESELAGLRAVEFDVEALGLENIQLDEPEEIIPAATKAPRAKTTIFVSVKNEDVAKARKLIGAALDKAKIGHNI